MKGGGNGACDHGCGDVFKITLTGELMAYSLDYADGGYPMAALTLATHGEFYGTTPLGGSLSGNGIVFKVTGGGAITPIY